MNWENIYLTCFIAGFVFSALTLIFRGGHSHTGHFHLHLHAHGGHARGAGLGNFNITTLAAFLCWFGAAGYLLTRHSTLWFVLALLIASVAGLTGAAIVIWFIAKFAEHEHVLDPADYEMVGVLGRVTSTLRVGGTGEIGFSRDGAHKASPARTDDGTEIGKGAEVIVTRFEKGIAYVRRWEDLAG